MAHDAAGAKAHDDLIRGGLADPRKARPLARLNLARDGSEGDAVEHRLGAITH